MSSNIQKPTEERKAYPSYAEPSKFAWRSVILAIISLFIFPKAFAAAVIILGVGGLILAVLGKAKIGVYATCLIAIAIAIYAII